MDLDWWWTVVMKSKQIQIMACFVHHSVTWTPIFPTSLLAPGPYVKFRNPMGGSDHFHGQAAIFLDGSSSRSDEVQSPDGFFRLR
jgi:hypothetical protein